MKPNNRIMWAVYNERGFGLGRCTPHFYIGMSFNRKDAIQEHTQDLGKDWKYCRRKGDRVTKIKISAID